MDGFSLNHLSFEKALPEQIDLLKKWLKKDYIKEYWGDGGLTLPDYKAFTEGQDSIFKHYFGYYKKVPIAFLMTSELKKGEDWDEWRASSGLTLSVDFMIGSEEFVGKGIAHMILSEFLKRKCFEAAAVLVDPEMTHLKAIHVYKKAGFIPQGIYTPKEGKWSGVKHLVMKRNR